ncbi:MAG: FCD domain-containing protein [Alphaproteobacteria bacterium]
MADLRVKFSTMALERSIAAGDEAWEAGIVAAYYQLAKLVKQMKAAPVYAEEWERRNRAFHAALEGACNSPWLLHMCELLYDQSERYRRNFVAYPKIEPRVYEEHRLIMEAVLARDAKAACRILAEHIRRGAAATRRLMEAKTGGRTVRGHARAGQSAAISGPLSTSPNRKRTFLSVASCSSAVCEATQSAATATLKPSE